MLPPCFSFEFILEVAVEMSPDEETTLAEGQGEKPLSLAPEVALRRRIPVASSLE